MIDRFDAGYACAAAAVLRAHGEDTIVEELLTSNGMTSIAVLRRKKVDPYDIEILRPVIKQIRSRKRRRQK